MSISRVWKQGQQFDNAGTLAPEEMAEYEAYIHAMDVVAVLQKQAGALLQQARPS